LLPTIELALKSTDLQIRNLNLIAVGNGPGSYTGTRVGVAAAKSFAYAAKLPLVGVSSLTSFVPDADTAFAAIIDAKIGGAYTLLGKCHNNSITYQTFPQLHPLSDLGALLQHSPLLITPQPNPLADKLAALYPNNSWTWQESWPSPHQMAVTALKKFQQGAFSTDASLEILYLRKTQAEIEKGH
jgi:tRNA threonylcarbamoyladenosine biosynthesis protein TsaB